MSRGAGKGDEDGGEHAGQDDANARNGDKANSDQLGGDEDMNAMLKALGSIARDEGAEMTAFASEDLPPPSASTRARIAERILNAQGAGDAIGARRSRPPRRTFFVAAGSLLAAAAALVIWIRSPSDGPALPEYTIAASGGIKESRGAMPNDGEHHGDTKTAAPQKLRAGSELVVTCRPETVIAAPVTARAFLVQGTVITEVRPLLDIAPSGSVQIRLHGSQLIAHGVGRASLRVAVGRPDAVQSVAPSAAITVNDAAGARWLTVPLDLEGR